MGILGSRGLRPFGPDCIEIRQIGGGLVAEGPAADAVRSYLAPGPEPRYDTPQAQAEAEAAEPEAGV